MPRPIHITVVDETPNGVPLASVVEYLVLGPTDDDPPIGMVEYQRSIIMGTEEQIVIYPIQVCLN